MLENYKIVLLFIILSVISFFLFLHLGLDQNSNLFSRGGSLIALFAVAAECRLSQVKAKKINEKVKGVGTLSGQVIQDLDAPPPFRLLRVISHLLVVVGTVIWGFGDLALDLISEEKTKTHVFIMKNESSHRPLDTLNFIKVSAFPCALRVPIPISYWQ